MVITEGGRGAAAAVIHIGKNPFMKPLNDTELLVNQKHYHHITVSALILCMPQTHIYTHTHMTTK